MFATSARRWLWALLLPVLAVALAGCAQPGTGSPRAAAATPATVTVGPADGGRTVELQAGDRLVVELTTSTPPAPLRPAWTLRLPPSGVLRRVPGDPDAPRVVLVADRPGTVRLVLARRYGCQPPLRCPVAQPSLQSERMRPPLERPMVTITVRVR